MLSLLHDGSTSAIGSMARFDSGVRMDAGSRNIRTRYTPTVVISIYDRLQRSSGFCKADVLVRCLL